VSKAPKRWTPEQAQAMREMLDRHERERAEAARRIGGRPVVWSELLEERVAMLERQVAELVQMLADRAGGESP
jgi:hypothetical protein